MANPYFSTNSAYRSGGTATLERPTGAPIEAGPVGFDAPSESMTYQGVVTKTAGLLIVLGLTAAAVWMLGPEKAIGFWIGGAIVAIVLSLVIAFRRSNNPVLITIYAAAEGAFLGGITSALEADPDLEGIGLQALLATMATAAVCLWLYRSGKVRVDGKFMRVLMIGMISYGVFCLVNIGLMLFTGIGGWGLRSEVMVGPIPLGVLVGAVAVLLASMSLIADFNFIQVGVEKDLDRENEWGASFGLVVTLVWLYLELLRILAILRGR